MRRMLGMLMFAALCGHAAAQTAQSLGAPAGDARRGERVFMDQLCYTCHGTVGQGGDRGTGPKLYPNPFPYQAFAAQVRKPRQVMPPYTQKNLPDQDLADIYHYLFTRPRSPAAADIPLLRISDRRVLRATAWCSPPGPRCRRRSR